MFDEEELIQRAHTTLKGGVISMTYSPDRLEVGGWWW